MTGSTIKLRPQEPEIPERKVRLRLPGRLAADLDDYRALYAQAHGQEIELAALIEGILEQFLASDRAFQRRQRTKQPDAGSSSDRASHGEDSQPLDRGR
jgi:hypothetical protein